MDAVYQPIPDVHVIPTSLPVPGVGVLSINTFLITAEEPVLVDTSMADQGPDFIEAVRAIVDLEDLAYIWLTHDDPDHTGSLHDLMELAPNAKLVTHGLGALRQAAEAPLDLSRVHAIRPGDTLDVGDRVLTATRPPVFDNPMSTGFVDSKTGAFFCVDSFGALLPEVVEDVADVPADALAGGMTGWSIMDSPWLHYTDAVKLNRVLDEVRKLAPSMLFSSHLPAASGDNLETFLGVLAQCPDAEPAVGPSAEEFHQMLAAMPVPEEAAGV